MRLRTTKAILWFIAGAGLTVVFFRLLHGLGSVVALTDMLPWGLWKGGGVVALVPVGGAGFTVAALVYIFQIERFKPLARGAVLLGLMCYGSVAVGLTLDIGISWRIVYPVVFWQLHSTLFEIAWCIMLYLFVLMLEFSHAVLERFQVPRVLSILEKGTIVIVIAGISLSTLHQSSLGTLFLATPFRLHPLWYTDLLPLLFFITSIGLGCLTITWVTLVVHWLFRAEPPMASVSALARIAFYVLAGYAVIRFGEILITGEASLLFVPSWDTANFWIELLLSALIPMAILWSKRNRQRISALMWASTLCIIGVSLNRVNVAGLATLSATNSTYFPAVTEWMITFGILSAAGLVYLFAVENFHVFTSISPQRVAASYALGRIDHADWTTVFFRNSRAELRLYSALFVIAIGLTIGFLPERVIYGVTPNETPTAPVRVVDVIKIKNENAPGHRYEIPLTGEQPVGEGIPATVFMIDGNRNGEYVLFDHDFHILSKGKNVLSDDDFLIQTKEQNQSCVLCHHMQKPFEKASSCHSCHTDMFLAKDIFNHDLHVRKTGGNEQCQKCHQDPDLPKVRANTPACETCHRNMRSKGSLVEVKDPDTLHKAVGYMDAMHSLCRNCHEQEQKKLAERDEKFFSCTQCHRDLPAVTDPAWAQKM